MSARVVLDTSVVILLMGGTRDADTAARRGYVLDHLTKMRGEDAVVVVPTPVIAELAVVVNHVAGAELMTALSQELRRRVRVQVLDVDAAVEAARLPLLPALQALPKGEGRGALRQELKFDALIAGTAVALGARWMLAADTDYEDLLHGTAVEFVNANMPPRLVTLTHPALSGRLPPLPKKKRSTKP